MNTIRRWWDRLFARQAANGLMLRFEGEVCRICHEGSILFVPGTPDDIRAMLMECTRVSGATQVWRILNRRSGSLIGLIKWYAPWRQYCFWPENVSVWSRGCLAEVDDFLRQLEDERKRRRIERAVEAKGEAAGLMALDRFEEAQP